MSGGQSVVLALALLALVAGAAATFTRSPAAARAAGAATVVSALAWALLLVMGARGRVAVFHVSPLVAAGGCGAALLVAAALEAGRRDPRAVTATVLALVAVTAGLAGGGEPGQVVVAGAMLAGLALAAVASIDALPPAERRLAVPFGAAGVAAAVVGFVILRAAGDRWSLPSTGTVPSGAIIAFMGAGAALVVAGTLKGRRPTGVLLAAGLVLGLAAGPLRPAAGDLAAVAIVLAVLAVVLVASGRGPAALGLLALALGAGPSALVPASRLLAAGSVVAAAVDRPAAWLAAVPGGVALAAGVVEDGGPLAGWLAVAAGLVAAGLAVAATVPVRGKEPPAATQGTWATPGVLPAVVTGAWLSLAPDTWTWTGAALDDYDRGAALAVAAGVLTVGAAVVVRQLRSPAGLRLPGAALRPSLDRLRRTTRRPAQWRPARRPRSPWPRRPWSARPGRPKPPPRR